MPQFHIKPPSRQGKDEPRTTFTLPAVVARYLALALGCLPGLGTPADERRAISEWAQRELDANPSVRESDGLSRWLADRAMARISGQPDGTRS